MSSPRLCVSAVKSAAWQCALACALLCVTGCGSNEPDLTGDVQHNRPVQVRESNPLANPAYRTDADRSKVIVVPHKAESTAPADPPKESTQKQKPIEQSPQTAPPDHESTQSAPAEPTDKSTSKNPISTSRPHWPEIDEAKVAAAGIRKLESRRLVLYTDAASSPDIDELPQVFDQAFDRWCRYFGLDAASYPEWRMRASLMDDRARFAAAGLLPPGLRKFLNGYTSGYQFWLDNQTSTYYCRHLFLHEGVHGFMFSLVGENGAPWYIEGMAEMLGTHRWHDGRLELPVFPNNPDDFFKLSRIEMVQRDFAAHRARQFGNVLGIVSKEFLEVEPYAWSWAAVAFLDGHPRYHDRFRKTPELLKSPGHFNLKLHELYNDDFDRLVEEWQVFIADIDYGYDFERTAIDFTPGKPLETVSATATVEADRGWQNSGLALEAGKTYKLTASGRFQLATNPKPWISEAGGVSIHYLQGKPLGILLAAVRPNMPLEIGKVPTSDEDSDGAPHGAISAFLKPIVVGLGTTIAPTESGTLYFRVNDSAGQLFDNAGHVDVQVSAD
jgi:hypothetical protein